jgi:hypothetical protein
VKWEKKPKGRKGEEAKKIPEEARKRSIWKLG